MLFRSKIFLVSLLVLLSAFNYSYAAESNNWKFMHGSSSENNYRFAEQYGVRKNLLEIDGIGKQRLDFTFSKKRQWLMYFTTSLLSGRNDQVLLHIDNKTITFEGQGCCHKQAFRLDEKIVGLLKGAKKLSVEEIYYPDNSDEKPWFHYESYFKTGGLKEALNWVGEL
jgi:hypothetical protein